MKKIIIILMFFIGFSAGIGAETITSPYLPWLQDRCAIYDVPMEIALAVAIVESNFYMIISESNWNESYDIGIFQINSKYVDYFEENFWYKDRIFQAQNPHDNIEMGILILQNLYRQTGSWDNAVRAYHSGCHGLKNDPDASRAYLVKVINVLSTLRIEKH